MEETGETGPYRAISEGCEACDNLADAVERYYAAGGSVSWDGWKVLRVRPYDRLIKGSYLMSVDATPTVYRESSSGPKKRLAGGRTDYVFKLKRKGTSWVVTDKDRLVS